MSGRTNQKPRPAPESNGIISLPDRLPPQSLDAEQSVLGAALISTKSAAYLASHLKRGDFYLEGHRQVFDVIQHLVEREQPVDVMSVPEELRRRGALEQVGGVSYITVLENSVPTAAHVEFYADVVLKKSALRKAIHTGGDLIARAYQELDDLDGLIADTTEALISITDRRAGPGRRVFSAASLVAEEMPEPVFTVPGLLTQGLYLLAGRAKQGKSWLAYQLAIAIASGGMALGAIPVEQGRVLYLALEDTKRRLKRRLVQLLGDEPVPELLDLATTWRRSNDGGIAELDAYCRKHPDTRLIIVDVFGRFRPVRERSAGMYQDDYADLGPLKELADRHDLTILVIHHQNKGKDHEDVTHSFSGSTGIAGAIDGWLVLKRERVAAYATLEVDGRDIEEPREVALEFDRRTIWTLKGDAQQYIHTREERDVMDLLRRLGEATAAKLATQLEIHPKAAAKRLQRMEQRGLLRVSGKGLYRLDDRLLDENSGFGVAPVAVSPVSACRRTGELEDGDDIILFPDGDSSRQDDTGDRCDTCDTKPPISRELPEPLELDPDTPPAEAELRHNTFRLAWTRGYPPVQLDATNAIEPGESAWRHACRTLFEGWLQKAYARLQGGRDG